MNRVINFEIVTLKWLKIEDIETYDFKHNCGIYQIYGDSPIYGQNTLLYIGMSENLKKRLKNDHHGHRDKSFITRQPNISYRVAYIDKESGCKSIEEILIAMHKPSFNSTNIINISNNKKAYYIQNEGERGMLHLEVTNFYFLKTMEENESRQ